MSRIVFVSGSSKGIGLGIAGKFLEVGDTVILNGRGNVALDVAFENLQKSYPGRVHKLLGDVSDPAACVELASVVRSKFGGLDVLICNVGSGSGNGEVIPRAQFLRQQFDQNFFSASNLMEVMLPQLIDKRGSVVIVGSIAGKEDVGAPVGYAAAKSSLCAYAKSLARALGPSGVRINLVSPGNIFFSGGTWDRKIKESPELVKELIDKRVPLRSFGTPEDVAKAVLFLTSNDAKFITGADLVVDGGQSCSL